MSTDPQPIPTPEGYDWYMPDSLNNDEWETIGRYPKDPSPHLPSAYDNYNGPVLARRKPPEPWVPKVGDRVRWGIRSSTVLGVRDDWYWILRDGANDPITSHVAYLSPLPEADQ